MSNLLHLRGDPHQHTQELLPWYITGALHAGDRLLIEAHLANCAECRADLVEERQVATAVRALPAGAPSAPQLPVIERKAEPWWRRPVRVTWFLAAQAAVLLLCVALVTNRAAPPGRAVYHTLGDAAPQPGGDLLVMFATGTTRMTVDAAVAAAGGRLVRGPTDTGAYLVAVPAEVRAKALARLRARPEVVLAERLDGPAP